MNLTLIPESAPFTGEQRAWLNGFLAGWLGLQEAAGPVAGGASQAPTAPPAPPAPAAEAEEFPWHDPAVPIVERMRMAGGRPLPRRLMAAMAQLDCGACGYVCRTYSEAIASGAEPRLTLCSPGGTETSKMIKRLLKEESPGANGATAPALAAEVAPAPAAPGWSREAPFTATLLRSDNLNRPGSEKETRHVELDLSGGGPAYEVGDALGVYPTNCGGLVDEVLASLGATGEEPVRAPGGAETTLRAALARHACLTEITDELLERLADAAADGREAEALRRLIDDGDPIAGFDVLDVLGHFPSARPAPAVFVGALAELKPRLYSISSSPKRHPGQVHLTVGKLTYHFNDRHRKGVASTMFADRLAPGEAVRVFVHKSHGFTVPADPAAPMIMIGPGTGIAPFRAFLQERDALGAPGPNWLFFGDQRGATDFLYEDELADFARRGLLTRLDTAFSRDQDRKVYVQHRMVEHGRDLFDWLERGAHVFVCGDARRMAADVDRALREVIRDHGGMGDDAATAYLSALASAGRYRRDVY